MKIAVISLVALAALSACSDKEEKEAVKNVAQVESQGRIKFSSPVEFSKDAKVKQKQQEELVAYMIKDPRVDLETIEGEAMRRGVKLTAEQIAYKKAHPVNRNAPYGAPAESNEVNSAAPSSASAETADETQPSS